MTTPHRQTQSAQGNEPFWRVYPLRETGKALRHELAVWVAPGVRRKMRIPAEWSAGSEAERERFAEGAAEQMRELYRAEQATGEATSSADPAAVTFDEFARLWTKGDLARQFPGHVKDKKTKADDVQKLDTIKPWVGSTPLRDFKVEHAERALRELAELGLSSTTLRGYAQVMHRVLALAVYPGKLLKFNPLPEGFLPDKSPARAKSFVYPSEEAALLACADVPLERRMLFGLMSREGMRLGEVLRLAWTDLDLERGTLSLDENKTDDPRTWALGADVAAALRLWERLRPATETLFDPARLGVDKRKLAGSLRADLQTAGVERAALFAKSEQRIPLRVHDLRASFVTLALADGRSEAWVTDRTGHRSSSMVANYKRQVRTAAELNLGWFAPLDASIPELVKLRALDAETGVSDSAAVSRECLDSNVSASVVIDDSEESEATTEECTRRDLNPHALRRRNLNPVRLPIPPLVLDHCWLR